MKLRTMNKEHTDIAHIFLKNHADCLVRHEIPARTVILNEGDTANKLYFIKKGCLRLWFNNNGKDVTFQFFFEDDFVASVESFMKNEPSLFSLESIEACTVYALSKKEFERIRAASPELNNRLQERLLDRLTYYQKLFLSHIKETPQERYDSLIKEHPKLILRIPQHYIASYLGITPVSLSRIRNRK